MEAWIHSILTPKIGVIAAHDISPILQSFGVPSLSFLFNPIAKCNATVRDENGSISQISDFRLKFVEAHRLEEHFAEVSSDLLLASVQVPEASVLSSSPPFPHLSSTDVLQQQRGAFPLPYPAPWYKEFQKWFLRLDSATEFDALHHPIGLIYAVSSKSTDVNGTLSQLTNLGSNLPAMTKGWMDPNVQKFYVLLHVEEENTMTDATLIMEHMKKTYGKHCYLLSIPPTASIREWAPSALWQPNLADLQFLAKYFPEQLGILSQIGPEFFVAAETVERIQSLVQILVNELIPFMQQCAAHWNDTVAAPRRGFTGRFFTASKKYFGARPSSAGSTASLSNAQLVAASSLSISSTPSVYSYDAHESLLRRLGDYLFHLRQHTKAAQIYQTAVRSFSYDKAWKHHACALEMAAICHILTVPANKDIDHMHEQILQSSATKARNATRATLLLSHLLSEKQPQLAIQVLARIISRESDLICALFLEQMALLYASCFKLRLASKYLVFAGNKYGKVGLRLHAVRCFSVALAHFPPAGWDTMRDHVLASLARHYFQLNSFDLAFQNMLQLVRPFQTQNLDELIYLYRHHPTPQPFYDLAVPDIQLLFTNDLCVNETAVWRLRVENTMQISLTLESSVLDLSSNALTCSIHQGKVALSPLSSVVIPFDVSAHAQGPFQVRHVLTTLNGHFPARLVFRVPVCGEIRPTQPRLEVRWQDLPSTAYLYQISRVILTLRNTGHVATGLLVFSHEGVHLHADNFAWESLAPGTSVTKEVAVQWLQPNAVLQWAFPHVPGAPPPFRVQLHVPLKPLFFEAGYLPLSATHICVTLRTAEHAVEGTFGTETPLVLAPQLAYTHVVPLAHVAAPATILPFVRSDHVYFHATHPAHAVVPLARHAPGLRCSLVHGHAARCFEPVDVSVRISNHTHVPLHLSVHVASDTAICMAGHVEIDPWIAQNEEWVMDWRCYPLATGVHDLSEFIKLKLVKEQLGVRIQGPEPSLLYVN